MPRSAKAGLPGLRASSAPSSPAESHARLAAEYSWWRSCWRSANRLCASFQAAVHALRSGKSFCSGLELFRLPHSFSLLSTCCRHCRMASACACCRLPPRRPFLFALLSDALPVGLGFRLHPLPKGQGFNVGGLHAHHAIMFQIGRDLDHAFRADLREGRPHQYRIRIIRGLIVRLLE